MGLMEAWRTRGKWESREGQIVRWLVYFVCLFAGLCAAVLVGPKAGIIVTVGALGFFLWWSSAFVGTHMYVNCLLIVVLLAVNIGVLQGCIGRLMRHKAVRDAVIQIK